MALKHYPSAPIGAFARLVSRSEEVTAGRTYRQIGVRLWGKGVYEREATDGASTRYQTLFRVQADDIVFNKIWARSGSAGVVPQHLNGCFGSGEFPTFEPDKDKINPRWFHWFAQTSVFWERCAEKSFGTSGKNRIKPQKILEIEIPLPPLPEQQRIVARIEALAGKIEAARGLRGEAAEETYSLLQATRRRLIGDSPNEKWVSLQKFGVSGIENGRSPQCETRPAGVGEWGVLKVGAVSFGVFDPQENKALPLHISPDANLQVRDGDFLMNRANTKELVAACAIAENPPPQLLLSDKIFRFQFNSDDSLNKRYLVHVLKSPALRQQIEEKATGTSPTMKNISKEKVLQLLVPNMDRETQDRVADRLDRLEHEVRRLHNKQKATQKELDALLPAILDRAFKGEL